MSWISKNLMLLCILHLTPLWLFASPLHYDAQELSTMIGHRPFVVLSPPKCGTHLVGKALELILQKSPVYCLSELGSTNRALSLAEDLLLRGHFAVAHNFNGKTLKKLSSNGYGVIFIIRDPRDQMISVQNWLQEGQWKWVPPAKIKNRKKQLTELITGEKKGWQCVESCFLKYANLLSDLPKEGVYRSRFENLVGDKGGGSIDLQVEEILGLAAFVNVSLSTDEAKVIAQKLFGGTTTFRQGQVGAWRKHFSKEHKEEFKKRYDGLLIDLGYRW